MKESEKTSILKRVLRKEKRSSRAVSEHSGTGAVPETVPEIVEAVIPTVEEEQAAAKRLRIERETAVVVFKPTDAAYKLFREKGVIEPRLPKEATGLSEIPFELGDDSTRHPHPQMSRFHTSSTQSQSLDIAGGERLVDTLMDFLGAEKALGAGASASDGRDPSRGTQAEAPAAVPGEEETCSLHIPERVEDPVVMDTDIETTEVVEAIPTLLDLNSAVAEPEVVATTGGGGEELAVAVVSELILTGGGDLPVSVPVESSIDPPAGGSHGTIPPDFPPRHYPSMANIEYVVEKILMKKLSNNWSLEAYSKKIEDTVARSKENKEANEKLAQALAAVEQALAAVKESNVDLWECSASQDVISNDMRGQIGTLNTGQELSLVQISDLHNLADKTTEEVSTNKAQIKDMMQNHSSFLEKHDIEHRAIDARLGSLEELRRYDNMSRGRGQTAEYNNAFMDGFQNCCEVLIAHGTFPRRMLNNYSFMNLVKDRDVLLQKIAEKDSQLSSMGESSQQQQQPRQQQQQQQPQQHQQPQQPQQQRQQPHQRGPPGRKH